VSHVITDIRPGWAVPGSRVLLSGARLPVPADGPPHVLVGGTPALVAFSSAHQLRFVVPADAAGGSTPVRLDELPGETAYLQVARTVATHVHHVDSPIFDAASRLYVVHSGSRGERPETPLFRFDADGTRTSLAVDVGNPTSLALGPDGLVYVSSRFDGHVHRLRDDDSVELFASGLGVATGLAFGPDGNLYVGDRSGTVYQVTPSREIAEFASLPPSVAAYHLAFGPGGMLYVAAPTLASRDVIYRVAPGGTVEPLAGRFGRPQGLAFEESGLLYVADALAGAAGLYRLDVTDPGAAPELVLSAPGLVGLAFSPSGGLALASNDSVWLLDVSLKPYP
jgi:sugar lactone lactonase YvrE